MSRVELLRTARERAPGALTLLGLSAGRASAGTAVRDGNRALVTAGPRPR